MDTDDRRKFERVSIAIAVRYSDHEEQVAVMSRDISLGGLFLGTVTPAPVATTLDLRLHLPAPHGEVLARGKVMHCLQGIGMGVEFAGFDGDGESRLRHYLELLSAP
ncbi:MAG TPA: PilZ domain-containing protein [Nannocystis sp.]